MSSLLLITPCHVVVIQLLTATLVILVTVRIGSLLVDDRILLLTGVRLGLVIWRRRRVASAEIKEMCKGNNVGF